MTNLMKMYESLDCLRVENLSESENALKLMFGLENVG